MARRTTTVADHPGLVREWHPDNPPAHTVSSGSRDPYRWRCKAGHEWDAPPTRRKRGSQCPACSYVDRGLRRQLKEAANNPIPAEHAMEWSARNALGPESFAAQSNKMAWWICPEGHEYEMSVSNKVGRGSGCPACVNSTKARSERKRSAAAFKNPLSNHPQSQEFSPRNEMPMSEYSVSSGQKVWWVCPEGHNDYLSTLRDKGRGRGCPHCANKSSRGERELAALIREWFPSAVERCRSVIFPLELDIYIPELRVGIEYNGLFWHSEAGGKTRNSHRDKYLACKDAGVRLIVVWEDEWKTRRDVVEHMLAHKLGISQRPKIHARKTRVGNLTVEQAKRFLDANHIQGWVKGSAYVGLFYGDDVVAALVAQARDKNNGVYTLDRYATSVTVPGGFSKLLKYAEQHLDVRQWVSFADLQVSDGGLYESNGFRKDAVIPPDYRYWKKGSLVREHKFRYRLKKFRSDPDLEYRDDATESELATLNGLYRIWDYGKIRYVKDVQRP